MTALSEIEIIRAMVKRGTVAEAFKESQKYIAGSQYGGVEDDKDQYEREQVKQCVRVWTALGKLVRSQTTKGRIIDTLYFGSFAKAASINEKAETEDSWGHYIYCPGPKSMFILVENA